MSDDQAVLRLAKDIEKLLGQPIFFFEVLESLKEHPYRSILRAWSDVRTRRPLARDVYGRYWLEENSK